MTSQKHLKRRVRERMAKTGERYAAARAHVVTPLPPAAEHRLDAERVTGATGQGYDEWFALLDGWGATERRHGEIATWLKAEHAVPGWWSQNLTVQYERERGMRGVGETASGYQASVTRTIARPIEELFAAFADPGLRARWAGDVALSERTAIAPRSIRLNVGDGEGRAVVTLLDKGDRTTVNVTHEKLSGAEAAESWKGWWRERLTGLKEG